MPAAKASGDIYQLKITLHYIRPPIWRRVQVRDCHLGKLHEVIQLSMGWEFEHLHNFDVGGEFYGEPDPTGMMEDLDERRLKLSAIREAGVKKFKYTYDFGDTWLHDLLIEKLLPAEKDVKYPRCVAGARACPPEDCGGPWGYGDFLDAISNPKNPNHEDMVEWIGGDFDPEAFDVEAVNKELQRLR